MNAEAKICQNCKQSFIIEPADFSFYEKLKIPPPTFCPQCRFQRRLMFRNERVFYKRDCEMCGKSVVARFAPERGYHVYCQPCWWSDKWDGTDYGMDYDPAKGFFEQLKELSLRTPHSSLVSDYSTLVNSDYVNHAGAAKNCYFIFNADYCDNVAYAANCVHAKDALDLNIVEGCELCYECINCVKCFNAYFSEDCTSSSNIYFSKDCVGCSNCFGCVGLRNKQYCWFNESVGKEEFAKRFTEARCDSRQAIKKWRQEADAAWLKIPRKFFHGTHNVNVSGDYINESKNSHDMYQCQYVEDSRYVQFVTLPAAKDVYDYTEWGAGAELICDAIAVGENARNVQYCSLVWSGTENAQYSFQAHSCRNIFGCFNLKKKEYCILNKQYSKSEYESLRKKIIADLDAHPYRDRAGREWKYGEFLPYDLSPYAYNETHAIQYYPLDKEAVLSRGWDWQDQKANQHTITMPAENIPDSIMNTDESILKEVLGCANCGKAYRLIPNELSLLKRFSLPVPEKCPDCRHMDRMGRINPPRLWDRQCAKCGTGIRTSYAPSRPEIVYCEQCYQREMV